MSADFRQRRGLAGNVPFGWRMGADGRLDHDAAQMPVVEEVIRRVEAGEVKNQIAVDLMRRGVPLKSGGFGWGTGTINSVYTTAKRRLEAEAVPVVMEVATSTEVARLRAENQWLRDELARVSADYETTKGNLLALVRERDGPVTGWRAATVVGSDPAAPTPTRDR